ncbi:hypothetical protein KC343_g19767, partial [Hortaea werneckii]
EAETWLETLTHSAVNQAKQAQQATAALLQNRRLFMRGGGRGQRMAVGGARPPPPAAAGAGAGGSVEGVRAARDNGLPGGMDQRSLDEIVKYINGEGGKQTTPKKGTRNPKRRQQKPTA